MKHMHKKAKSAYNKLLKLGAPVYEWRDTNPNSVEYRGHFWICAEEENSYEWADYYENFWGSEKLNKILEDAGLYFEWYNAGYACVYDLG